MRRLYERRRYRVGWLPVRIQFWRVLQAIDLFSDPVITLDHKIDAACALFTPISFLLPRAAKTAIVYRTLSLLFPHQGNNAELPVMDFAQDAGAIRASFLQAYGIDLDRSNLSFFDFRELIEGLPDNTIFARIVDIRRRPLPEPTKTNAKEIDALQRAKKAVEIKVSDDERARIFAESLRKSTLLKG